MPIQEKKPIVVRDTSACVSHADRVENTSRNGRPAEKPRKPMPITRGLAYTAQALRHCCSRLFKMAVASEDDIIIRGQRRMIGQPLSPIHGLSRGQCRQAWCRDVIIDAPADVLLPGAAAIRPPGVFIGIRVEAP